MTEPNTFISYRQFEEKVANCLSSSHAHFSSYRHVLPSIPWRYRQRFIDTLCTGCDIPLSFDILLPSQKLPPGNYMRYVKYASTRSITPTLQFS